MGGAPPPPLTAATSLAFNVVKSVIIALHIVD
jgi:hypothetical protein